MYLHLLVAATAAAGMLFLAHGASAAEGAAAKTGSGGQTAEATVLYVSPAGNDAWSGRLPEANAAKTDGPLATPARARDAVRALKAEGRLAGPVTVQLRGGTYSLDAPLVLTPDDSGAEAAPIAWVAAGGEKPVLSGGRRITGFAKGDGGRWTAPVPEAKEGKGLFRQLFVDGERRERPRLPREGYYKVVAMPGVDMTKVKYDTASNAFEFKPGDLKASWTNLQDVEVTVFHFWVDTHLKIASIDEATHVVTFDRKARRKFTDDYTKEGARYVVTNVPEALDRPGEWYLDRKAGVLHYLPRPGEDMAKAEVIAPRLGQILRLEGDPAAGRFVEHVAFRGLTFAHTEYDLPPASAGDLQAASTVPGAVWMRGARDVTVSGCTVANGGTYGVELAEGCRRVRIVGNEIAHLGGGGVRMTGGGASSPEALRTAENTVADNHIHDGGEVWNSAVGILAQNAAGNDISHNHIHDLYYTGISIGWVWGYGPSVSRDNKVEYNHIHDIGKGVLSDMGGIYSLGVSPGTVVRGNVIHDILSHGYGGWGIYTDEGSTDMLIEGNLVYRTKTGGFHQHYGKENILRNNIFAFATVGQLQRTRQEPHKSFTFENNIVYWTEGPLLHGNWKDNHFSFDKNVYWNAAGKPVDFAGKSLDDWRQDGQDAASVVADPLFAAPEKGDFTLRPGSPALKLGFKPIDPSAAGVRNPARRSR
jgi:hypothetical protein